MSAILAKLILNKPGLLTLRPPGPLPPLKERIKLWCRWGTLPVGTRVTVTGSAGERMGYVVYSDDVTGEMVVEAD